MIIVNVLYLSTQMTIINHEYYYHKGYDVTGPFFKVAAAIFAFILVQKVSFCLQFSYDH